MPCAALKRKACFYGVYRLKEGAEGEKSLRIRIFALVYLDKFVDGQIRRARSQRKYPIFWKKSPGPQPDMSLYVHIRGNPQYKGSRAL
jgi:hypothetical protein